eukprot:1156876-Pelagomonas_calceolata.AAC.10
MHIHLPCRGTKSSACSQWHLHAAIFSKCSGNAHSLAAVLAGRFGWLFCTTGNHAGANPTQAFHSNKNIDVALSFWSGVGVWTQLMSWGARRRGRAWGRMQRRRTTNDQ